MSHRRPVVAPEDRSLWTDLDNFGWRVAATFAVTLAWLFAGFCASILWGDAGGWLVFFLAFAVLALWFFGPQPWSTYALRAAPLVGDFYRYRHRSRVEDGRRAALALGLVTEDTDPATYRARFCPIQGNEMGWLMIRGSLPVLSSVEQVTKAVQPRTATVGAKSFKIERQGVDCYVIGLFPGDLPDPLAALPELSAPLSWSGDFAKVPAAIREDGSTVALKLRDCSGTVVGGLPGAGKTSGLTCVLSSLVASDSVQFLIWDGKGGSDWEWMAPRAALWNADDEDRARVADELESLVAVMRERVRNMKRLRGGSSIWDTGGPSPDLPLLVLVVDECHTYLDEKDLPKGDKEAAAIRQRTENALATLVKKGRSSGIWVVLATQKPTADSLPTKIGSNAASAISFRVKTAPSEQAILGSAPGPGDPTATELPADPGYAVLATERGDRERVRFPRLPESVAESHARAHQHLAWTWDRITAPTTPAGEPADDAGHGPDHDGG